MLEQTLLLLGLSNATDEIKDKVQTILDMTEQRLSLMLGMAVPSVLSYIVVEVAIARYNRIGSEGVTSHSVQGETMTWADDDFDPYKDDIQAWLDAQDDPTITKGRIRFI